MREIVDRILDGKFNYERGTLDFSCSRIDLSLCPDTEYVGSFSIYGQEGVLTEGNVYSYDIRMSILTDSFLGASQEIGYSFSTLGLEEGDCIKGEIYIISNQGEFFIPYTVNVVVQAMETSMGSIKNLFHFTNLAKSDWNEAVKLFYKEEFASVFKGSDKQYYKTYVGLSRYYGNEQNVEEFLLEINKKHEIEYLIEKAEIVVSEPSSDVMEHIVISRNGWGYTYLNVETDSDFIGISKTTITDDDFLGNYLKFPVIILKDLLHEGNNYASVRFYNAYTSVEVKVSVVGNSMRRNEIARKIEFSKSNVDLMKYFLDFRNRKIDTDTWIAQSSNVIDRMQSLDDDNISVKLYKAQLLLTEERYNEAKWILDQVEGHFSLSQDYTSPVWAYYLYLTTLYNREEEYVNEIADEILNIYNNDSSKWQVGWILLYISDEYVSSQTSRWVFIESMLRSKCTSPVFYAEALSMIVVNPSLLTKMDLVEQRIIKYAIKNDLLTEEIKNQIHYIASTKKHYSDVTYEVLKGMYEQKPLNEILETICDILISAGKTENQYFEWYQRGVENQCHSTRLYEFYMMSLDTSKDIALPKMVYLYFSYHSDLDWQHNAYLYARVIGLKNIEPELFASYRDEISSFAMDMIMKGLINSDLATIYKFVINENVISDAIAGKLSSLIFANRITVKDERISKVIVYQCKDNIESSFAVNNGEAFVPIYSNEFLLLFEDALSNRYMKNIEYSVEKILIPGKIASMLTDYVKDNLYFDTYLCESGAGNGEIDEENHDRYQRIMDCPTIESEYKTQIRSRLLAYYYDHDSIREMDELLMSVEPETINSKERAVIIRHMIIRGMYDRAFDWLSLYGTENVEPKDILRLCSKLLARAETPASQELTSLCFYIFGKGKYDENVLKYLIDNFKGMTKDNRRIFTCARALDMDLYLLCENAVIQMLYTGYYVSERMDIYRRYVEVGGQFDIRLAFLAQCSYEFFVKDQLMESLVFEQITDLYQRGNEILLVCKLAYVKYYLEHKRDITPEIDSIIREFLKELISQDIYLSFFKEYLDEGIDKINDFSDKTIIEYKTVPGRKVLIHYIVESEDENEDGEYITREMKEMYYGLHAKSFILFFGEKLMYYITEEADGQEYLTESGSVSKSDISQDLSDSRFSEINDIVIAKTLKDYETTQSLIDEFYRKEFVVNKLFDLQ